MNRPPVPIASLARRLPEAGRIRTGVKTARAMKAIDTFRFTSSNQRAIEQVAAIYGGAPKPWRDAPTQGQWEVITDASEIAVVLPPDPLGGTPLYEAWTGGGCSRRCDGETCQIVTKGPDGADLEDVDCLCVANNEMVCTPHTRLSVILPDVEFAGTWRYESAKSWQVAQELPGMVELIQSLQARGLTRALLAIEHRKNVTAGETHRYTIPVLRTPVTLDALAAGDAQVGAIGASSSAPALGSGSSKAEPVPPQAEDTESVDRSADDEVIDAELVEDVRTLADVLPDDVPHGKALAMARNLAPSFGITSPPTALEQVTDYRLVARVLDELGCTEMAG